MSARILSPLLPVLFFLQALAGQVEENPTLPSSLEGNETEAMLDALIFGTDENSSSPDLPLPSPSNWSNSLTLSLGGGLHTNPMQGPFVREKAGYVTTSIDSFLLRMGEDSSVFYLYIFGEGSHYEGIPSLELAGIALAQAEYSRTFSSSGLTAGLRARHVYYDLAFDLTENLDAPFSLTVQSNKTEVRPFLAFPVGEKLSGGIEVAAARDVFAETSENYKEKEFRTFLKWRGKQDSTAELALAATWMDYDSRVRRMADGWPLDGLLETKTVGADLTLYHPFGEEKEWSARLTVNLRKLYDNAEGYYDLRSLSGRLTLAYERKPWEASATVGGGDFAHDVRPISFAGPTLRRRSFSTEMTVRRSVNDHWKVFAKWTRERDDSNSRDFEYDAQTYSAGVEWSK